MKQYRGQMKNTEEKWNATVKIWNKIEGKWNITEEKWNKRKGK